MDRPIGIFDSGVGGLTVARELFHHLPYENVVYFGDTAHLPYGSKSARAITRFSLANTKFLLTKRIKVLVVACNTASALSLKVLRREFPLPMVGVILPGVEKALVITRGSIGVIGTESTIKSGVYQEELRSRKKSLKVMARPCPLFVPLVEEGWCEDKVTLEVAERYLEPFKKEGVDTLILGCTHYPLLKVLLSKVMGKEVRLVDSAEEVALFIARMLGEAGLLRKGEDMGYRHYFVSDLHEKFIKVGELFLGERLTGVKEVNLEKFYG